MTCRPGQHLRVRVKGEVGAGDQPDLLPELLQVDDLVEEARPRVIGVRGAVGVIPLRLRRHCGEISARLRP